MHDEIFRALEAGATVITAGRRLARVLASEFHSRQVEQGRGVWNRPDVLPLAAFVDRTFQEWLDRWVAEDTPGEDTPILLDAAQEQMLWEQIIRDSPAGESLLQIPQAASQAMETWRLVAEYRLPVDGSFEAAEDWAAFARWAREFQRRCRANGWLESARLVHFLCERIRANQVAPPKEFWIAGFDELTPLQTEVFDALGKYRRVEQTTRSSLPELKKLRDAKEEIRAAAVWSRRLLERNPGTRIGIIVAPDLTRSRAKVERIFEWALGDARAFHLSMGPTLVEHPLVRAALLLLEFAAGNLTLPRAGMLLRSPFIGGAENEWARRAQLDARLRKHGVWDVSVSTLRGEATSCPQLQRVLGRVQKLADKLRNEQAPSEWMREIEALLEAFGWPGERTPTSIEFQTIGAWRELLSGLAKLDLIAPRMSFSQMIDRLQQQAAEARFQVEDEGAPVQVMGMLEASGLRFDHLWILGLHDEALPASASPNPFLPTSLQREHRLPHSSAERELEFAKELMEGLLASAPDVVLSYPETEGDRALMPSPLISGGAWLADEAAPDADWIAAMRESAMFEEIADETAPALAQTDSTGGSSLFKDMAACPFRAFAKHRLGAKPLEEPELGLSYGDRGSTVHKALEFVWRQLGSRARLLELGAGELRAVIAAGADEAVAKLGPGIGRDLEKTRLQKLVGEWLEIERTRPDFVVTGLEAERDVDIGGVQVHVRADRVDALPDGREVIIDYKTSAQLRSDAWEGERPAEPQVPLYCATSDRPVAAAAFAMIRIAELRFRGVAQSDVSLPSMKEMTVDAPSFDAQLVEWRRVLERLAEEFRAGDARVDPKHAITTCRTCGLRGLCRIREYEEGRP
ncbi:MAG TPA: PD-(D/E)XK nuclease family protein [Bryobacteraceae bacterium]|nr:PD-(D/E)XK nuclease family protein [Bryobacteraceae bacterium]